MNIQRGTRDKLDKYVDLNQNVEVLMNVAGSSVYDYSCFGVDEAGKLSDDRYMVFYNQVQSPNGEVVYSADGQGAKFVLKLAQLPTSINKLVFTVSIDGNGTMGDITSHVVSIGQNGQQLIELRMSGNDFHSEKAIIAIEIYKRDVWRFAAVALTAALAICCGFMAVKRWKHSRNPSLSPNLSLNQNPNLNFHLRPKIFLRKWSCEKGKK